MRVLCTPRSLEEEGLILRGELVCSRCQATYPIRKGVPNLVPRSEMDSSAWELWERHLEALQERRQLRQRGPQWASRLGKGSPLQRAFADFLGLSAGRLLDVGCGPGKFRRVLEGRVEYFGLDPIPLPGVEGFPFVKGLAEYLPFKEGSFDHVTVLAALDHFNRPHEFFREVSRVLRPGGFFHLVQSIHDIRGPVSAVRWLGHRVKDLWEQRSIDSSEVPKHLREFTAASLIRQLEPFFDLVSSQTFTPAWYKSTACFLTLRPRRG